MNRGSKIVAAGLSVLGAVLFYFCGLRSLLAALRNDPEIDRPIFKGALAGLVGLVLGLIILIGGKPAMDFLNPPPGKSKIPAYLAAVVIVGGCTLLCFGLVRHIGSLGYE